MRIISVVKNLKRLKISNATRLILFKLKKKLKIESTRKEKYLSVFYNYLVKYDGYLIKETNKYYLINFKNKFSGAIKLRKIPSSDFSVFHQVIELSEYLPVVINYEANFKNSSNYSLNIIDAGSNIGLTSLYFMDHFQIARIIAVEPDHENFQMLNYNLKEKKKIEFIKIKCAIWSSSSRIKVVNDFRDKSDWSFRVQESNEEDALEAFSINDLIAQYNFSCIDILKIDIEGAEKEIFTSQSSNLNFLSKTKCIAIEIHDEFECREEINLILESYGFRLIREGELTIGINAKLIG